MASWKAVGVEENMLLRLGRKERPKEGDTGIPNTCPLHPPRSGFRAWKGMVLYFVGLGLADEKDVTVSHNSYPFFNLPISTVVFSTLTPSA
eukprot:1379409-Amorphochlora_amoeboformis.AAC.1